MLRNFWCLFLLLILLGPAYAAPMSASDAVVKEAEAFLSLLDQQRYADAWGAGTRYFQSRLTVQTWQQILKKYREPLGPVRARRRLATRNLNYFETAPPGLYMQVEFRSTFGRTERLERLVFLRDIDGYWRITAYQLR